MQTDEALVNKILTAIARMPMEEVLDDLNLLRPEEAAKKLQIGESTFYNLVNKGEVPATKIGGAVRVRPRALYAYVLLKEKNGQPMPAVAA